MRTLEKISSNFNRLSSHLLLIQPEKYKTLTSNSILILDETNLLIDTGFQFDDGRLVKLKAKLESKLDLLIFSHYHVDHTFGSWVFQESSKLIHSVEKEALGSLRNFIRFSYNTDKLDESSYQQWADRFLTFIGLDGISSWDELSFENIQDSDFKTPLGLGSTTLEFIHLPGHSPGHTGFYSPIDKVLFIGDIVITGRFGPWYGWRNSSLPAFRESVDKVLSFLTSHDKIRWVVTSHSRPLSRDKALEYLQRFTGHFDIRKEKILTFLFNNPQGMTLSEITREAFVYGKGAFISSTPEEIWLLFEKNHIEHHLEELKSLDLIYQENGRIFAQNRSLD